MVEEVTSDVLFPQIDRIERNISVINDLIALGTIVEKQGIEVIGGRMNVWCRVFFFLCVGIAALVLAVSCATPAKISRGGKLAGHALTKETALGALIEVAIDDADAHADLALARFVEEWKRQRGGEIEGMVHFRAKGGGKPTTYVIRFLGGHQQLFDGSYGLNYFDSITPAEAFRVRKIEHYQREGVGAPLVAVRENRQRNEIEKYYPPEAITRALTAVITSVEKRGVTVHVEIQLLCPLWNDETVVNGRSQMVAADFSVPWALLLSRSGKLSRSKFCRHSSRKPQRAIRSFT